MIYTYLFCLKNIYISFELVCAFYDLIDFKEQKTLKFIYKSIMYLYCLYFAMSVLKSQKKQDIMELTLIIDLYDNLNI